MHGMDDLFCRLCIDFVIEIDSHFDLPGLPKREAIKRGNARVFRLFV